MTSVAVISKSERSLASYAVLRTRVREALRLGRKRAEEAVEQEKVRTSWEVGKLVQEHILLNKARASYGEQVIKRLSADISISARELHYMVEFARAAPILRTSAKLSWGHHEALLGVNDDQERAVLARRAEKNNWTVKKLRRKIATLKTKLPKALEADLKEPLLEPQRGIPYTYKIVKLEGRLQIDLGFSNYLLLPQKNAKSFKEGDIIQAIWGKGDTYQLRKIDAGFNPARDADPEKISKSSRAVFEAKASNVQISADSTQATGPGYTYHARVLAITDADTLWAFIDLGFGLTTVQQLRLRGLDAPEISSRDGQAAKRFVEKEFSSLRGSKRSKAEAISAHRAPEILITSSKSDKYDRYLADVFYTVKGKETFLNNELLKRGLAMRV